MKLSRQTKEIIQVVVFLVVAAALIVAFIVYPLGRVKDQFGRSDIEQYENEDTVILNDPAVWIDYGLPVDTFKVESDGLTVLACLIMRPDTALFDSAVGSVLLVHDERYNRDSLMPLAEQFWQAGYVVIVYDQRASGYSTGKYHGEGRLEADDLEAIISYADLRTWLQPPLTVIGFGLGGDAGIIAAREEQRIRGVVAYEPYLTTERYVDILKDRFDTYWLPFYKTIMFWWYGMRSGYASQYRGIEYLEPVTCPTLILTEHASAKEMQRLKELSGEKLTLVPLTEQTEVFEPVRGFIEGTVAADSVFIE